MSDKKPLFGILAGEPEIIGERCADGGKCHHRCAAGCWRRTSCAPLSGSGLRYDWSAPALRAHDGLDRIASGFVILDGMAFSKDEILAHRVDLCNALLEAKGVACVPGSAFGEPRALRISYTCPEAQLAPGLDRIREFFAELR